MVTAKELKAESLRRKYLELLERPDTFPSPNNWAYIIEERMPGLSPALYRKYLVAGMLPEDKRSALHLAALRHFPEYLKVIDRREAISTVYHDRQTSPGAFIKLVTDCQLFDASHIMEIVEAGTPEDLHIAAELLSSFQPVYERADLVLMHRLRERLRELPPLGQIEERRGLLGITRKYICPNGHINDGEQIYCDNDECRLDIRGLCPEDEEALEKYDELVDCLAELLNRTDTKNPG